MTERDHNRGEGPEPLDEEAAWAQIVAAYGEEPADPPGGWPPGEVHDGDPDPDGPRKPYDTPADDRPGPDGDTLTRSPFPSSETAADTGKDADKGADADGGDPPLRSFTVYAAGAGPRDWRPAEPSDDDFDEDDEGHFVPPEPPPLPQADPVTKFAWAAALGGPLLLVLTVLFQQEMTWWITTLGVGGFLGGFATLVTRLRDGGEDDGFDDPGRGAVV